MRDGRRVAAAAVCCIAAAAHADEVRVGRYRMLVPDGTAGAGIEFSTAPVGGNSFVQAFFAISSGAMLDVTALVPMPFDGLPVRAGQPENRSKVPDKVIAWGLLLADQVKSGVLSISGRWQVPPIVRPNNGTTTVVLQ